jgi:photosynthetic reaction center H subunit
MRCDALTAAQFADVPATRNPDVVTLMEEERVVAYYGGGMLYATPERAEPLV